MSTAPTALKSPTSRNPRPKGTQVLVRVRACGLNRADLGMTKGHAHGSAGGVGTVLGMEWAGEVAELGPDAKGVKVGDRVMGSGGAAFAEYTLADHGRLFRAPVEHELRGSRHPARRARHHAQRGRHQRRACSPGQSVLIQGASSGVGLMAMQIAKLKGAKTRDRLLDRCDRRGRLKEFGADLAVDFSRSRLGRSGAEGDRAAKASTSSSTRSPARSRARTSRRPRSRAASSMSAGSAAPMATSISTCMPRAASTISASPSAPASIEEIREIFDEVRKDIWPRGGISASCSCRSTRCYAFADIGKAFEHMEANKHLGKIVVTL